MKIPAKRIVQLNVSETKLLELVRAERRFDPELYARLKISLFERYMDAHGLKACVVGLSGGIDSAVVAAILAKTKYRIVGASLPSYHDRGVTDQEMGKNLSEELAKKLGIEYRSIDVSHAVQEIDHSIRGFSSPVPSDWAYGQLTPYTRTPFLYYITTLLGEQGYPAILVGTTNRDEGAYLGYIGKASDGMVDVQLISDLHKSEVRSVAKYLGVSQEIIDAVPKGDMFDSKTDEEIFGASYDFVELFLSGESHLQQEGINNLNALHRYNRHKYYGGSPAVHLDIQESGVRGGWPIQFETEYWQTYKELVDSVEYNHASKLWTEMKTRNKELIYEDRDGIYRLVGIAMKQPNDFPHFLAHHYCLVSTSEDYYIVIERIKHS